MNIATVSSQFLVAVAGLARPCAARRPSARGELTRAARPRLAHRAAARPTTRPTCSRAGDVAVPGRRAIGRRRGLGPRRGRFAALAAAQPVLQRLPRAGLAGALLRGGLGAFAARARSAASSASRAQGCISGRRLHRVVRRRPVAERDLLAGAVVDEGLAAGRLEVRPRVRIGLQVEAARRRSGRRTGRRRRSRGRRTCARARTGAQRGEQFEAVVDEFRVGGQSRRSLAQSRLPPPPASAHAAHRPTMPCASDLIAARQALPDRLERAVELQSVLRVWLVGRAREDDRRLLADQGRVRSAAGAVPLDRGRARRRDRAASACRSRTAPDRLAALSRLVPRLPDGAGRLRHPQAQGHRRVRARAAGGALPRLRPGRRAPGLRRRLLRPHAAVDPRRGR